MLPPLAMIDDICSFSLCGPKSLVINTFINTKVEMKKMQFGISKCLNIHVGTNSDKCLPLKVHGEQIDKKNTHKIPGRHTK